METLCLICLSNDRKLFFISTPLAGIMRMILPEIEVSKLCWECLASLKHLLKLRKRALNSKQILDIHFKVNNPPMLQSSSNLGTCYIFTFSLGDHFIEENKFTKNIESKLSGNTELKNNTEGKGIDLGLSKNTLVKDNKSVKKSKSIVKSRKKKKVRSQKKVISNKEYSCSECKEKFESRGKYEYHRQKHRGRVKCLECNRDFSSRSSLSTHNTIVHSTTPTDNIFRHYCQPCDKFFKTSCSYNKHIRISSRHIDPQLLRYCCPTCGKGFLTCEERDRHNEMIHLQKNRLQCTRCPRKYCSVRALRCHMRRHIGGITKRDYMCEICGIGFKTSQVLKGHQKVHEKVKSQEK
ncbi:PREDICTED: zinc finger protein 58-like [Papilio xuthus]|uniref:Zinc finger protein 58-like n=1 Tax=Papilio xuthus TaxID=66420 RepID=A0AAJ7E5D4_PAPXU|nr:PREDICTED: zinc finger protein 58-like [Papilio xuthus]